MLISQATSYVHTTRLHPSLDQRQAIHVRPTLKEKNGWDSSGVTQFLHVFPPRMPAVAEFIAKYQWYWTFISQTIKPSILMNIRYSFIVSYHQSFALPLITKLYY